VAWLRLLPFALAVGLLGPLPVRGAEGEFSPVPVVDMNVHLPYQLTARGRSLWAGSGQADPARLRRGGAYGVVLPLLGARRGETSVPTLEVAYHTLALALRAEDALRAPGCRSGGPGIRTWLAVEGADELASAPSKARLWAARGVRFFGLVRDEDNALATSSHVPPPVLTGLSAAGRDLVKQVHAAGALVDVSHASEMTTRDVIEMATDAGTPVVASHSNARVLADDPRNLSDEQLRSIAATGGVVGITFGRRRLARGREADLSDAVAHVRHVAKVAGIEHVAIGSGFEGGLRPPHALLNAGRYQRLARALADAGMERSDVRKVMALNALRVLCATTPTRKRP